MRRTTRRTARFLSSLAVLALALAPALAEARPGGGSSSGSRGARTYQAPPPTRTAPEAPQRFDRTQTAPSQPGAPSAAPGRPGAPATAGAAATAGAGAARGNWLQRNPFLAGFLGAGLFGMLLGGGLFGGLSGLAGFFGLLLQIGLIALLVMLAVRLFRRRQQPAMAGGAPNPMMRERMDEPARGRPGLGGPGLGASGIGALGATGLARGNSRPADEVGIRGEDFAAFEELLARVNDAWSRRDIATLQRIATPEMAQFFRDDCAALDARGWRNETRDVKLEQGDLAEAWEEGARSYATVAMRFSLVDVTRDALGNVVEGDPERRQEAKELWTFVRVPSGPWTLSAIQQVG